MASNPEHLQALCKNPAIAPGLPRLDLNGHVRRLAAATFPAAAGKDLNGACLARWGKEAHECYDELTSAIFSNTMA